jgi:hypothetical protein
VAHDVFISHAAADKAVAESVRAGLESSGIGCWMATRDIHAGETYGRSIIEAINACKIMVVVFSSAADDSPHVLNEVERFFNAKKPIVPFLIENIEPSGDNEYFLARSQRLDASDGKLEANIARLAVDISRILDQLPELEDRAPEAEPQTSEPRSVQGDKTGEPVPVAPEPADPRPIDPPAATPPVTTATTTKAAQPNRITLVLAGVALRQWWGHDWADVSAQGHQHATSWHVTGEPATNSAAGDRQSNRHSRCPNAGGSG